MEDFYLDGSKKEFAVVIPVYNGAPVLKELCLRIMQTLKRISTKFEIILVDDCSKDNSWQEIQHIKQLYFSYVKGIRLSKNYGQHNATLCGIKHSNAEIIITIDDDLEFLPEDIISLVEKYKEGKWDVVYGVDTNKKVSFSKKIITAIFRKIQGITKNDYIRGSSFRLINGKIARLMVQNSQHFSFIDEFIRWYTSSMTTIPIKTQPSKIETRYKISRLFKITSSLIYLSSSFPLRLITWVGFFMMVFNFLAGIFIIYRRLVLTIDVKGYTSIIVTVLFSFGLLIFSLGIIAEYIGKILKINYNKPAFFEAEVI